MSDCVMLLVNYMQRA